MGRIPGSREIDRALRRAIITLKGVVKQGNQKAAKLIARGHYGRAEAVVEAVRRIPEFRASLESLRRGWRTVSATESVLRTAKSDRTPLWTYYKPVLSSLAELGGDATIQELERHLGKVADQVFESCDLAPDRAGRPRWRSMLKRARRAMVQEGLLDQLPLKRWRLTDQGRQAAASHKAND